MNTTATPDTERTLSFARSILTNTEDEPTVTVHPTTETANRLIRKAGIKIEARKTRPPAVAAGYPATYDVFVLPDGDHVWERDEALSIALIALTLPYDD